MRITNLPIKHLPIKHLHIRHLHIRHLHIKHWLREVAEILSRQLTGETGKRGGSF